MPKLHAQPLTSLAAARAPRRATCRPSARPKKQEKQDIFSLPFLATKTARHTLFVFFQPLPAQCESRHLASDRAPHSGGMQVGRVHAADQVAPSEDHHGEHARDNQIGRGAHESGRNRRTRYCGRLRTQPRSSLDSLGSMKAQYPCVGISSCAHTPCECSRAKSCGPRPRVTESRSASSAQAPAPPPQPAPPVQTAAVPSRSRSLAISLSKA